MAPQGSGRRRPIEPSLITPDGGVTGGYATKILWHIPGGSAVVTINGQRLDAPGRFRQRFPVSGHDDYPSIVRIPTAGCWRVTVSSAQHTGRFALLAVSP
jgi:hypothetical protein